MPVNPIFKKLTSITLFTLYLLVLAGGIVRSTGSGLGCPDWPKCFGSFIPPIHESELPANYKQKFKIAGKQIADFDPFKTWIEYLNRLLGAVVGVEVFLLFLFSLSTFSYRPSLTLISFVTLITTALQGWIGSKVVSTHLTPYVITIHMLVAVFIIWMVMGLYEKVHPSKVLQFVDITKKKILKKSSLLLLFLSLFQIILGTRVREKVDVFMKSAFEAPPRKEWILNLGDIFDFHRIFALLITGASIYLIFNIIKASLEGTRRFALFFFMILITNLFSGSALYLFHFPSWAQPLHLLAGIMMATVCFQFIMRLSKIK